MHLPAIAGPYAWTLFGLFWNGAVAVDSNKLPARIVANVFIWVLFAVGSGHIVSTQDYILGYCLSWLMLGEHFHLSRSVQGLILSSVGRQATRNQGCRFAVDFRIRHFCDFPDRIDLSF